MEGAFRTPTAPARESENGAALNAEEPTELSNRSSIAAIGTVPHETVPLPRCVKRRRSGRPPKRKKRVGLYLVALLSIFFFLAQSHLTRPLGRGFCLAPSDISRNDFLRCAARADDELVHDEPHTTKTSEPLSIPSFPEISNEWGYTGSRYQGPNRAFPLQGASSYEEHIQRSNVLPSPVETGHRIIPDDLQEAVSFITQRGRAGIKGFWIKQLSRIQQRAHELMPILHQLRASADPSREPSRARLHVPLLKELLAENGVGGSEWCDKCVTGFPISGELGEPGVYPPSNQPPSYISREELFEKATERLLSNNRTSDPNGRQLWFDAMGQVKEHMLDGPHRYSKRGELIANDEPALANPAFRFGVQ